MENWKVAINKTSRAFGNIIPIIISILLLISIVNTTIPKESYKKLFGNNEILNSIIGASIGSIAAGNPITSYIIGGELKKEGISMIAITSFILAWVTVGLIQLPAEIIMLGKKFAITRNLLCFVFSIIIAFLVVFTLSLIWKTSLKNGKI